MRRSRLHALTCALDPAQNHFWGILGAQVFDTKGSDLPQTYLWRVLLKVLSQTCAPDPSQKYLWGTLGAQVFDTREGDRPQKYL